MLIIVDTNKINNDNNNQFSYIKTQKKNLSGQQSFFLDQFYQKAILFFHVYKKLFFKSMITKLNKKNYTTCIYCKMFQCPFPNLHGASFKQIDILTTNQLNKH